MSSRREGYWISPVGKAEEVIEHFSEIREHPKRFGFTEAEAALWTRANRDEIVTKAVLHGWIRVREHGASTTFDVPELTQDVIFSVTEHLKKTGAWVDETVKIHEVKHKKISEVNAGWFLGGEALGAARNPKRRRK